MSTPTDPQDPYGQQQPGYGQQPPQYGQQPPQYSQQPAYGQQPGYSAPPPGYGGGTEKNNLGVWSLVLGIAALVCCGLLAGIPAIILGNKSRQAAAMGQADNGTMGQIGMILGWISIAFSVLGFIWWAFLGGMGAFSEIY